MEHPEQPPVEPTPAETVHGKPLAVTITDAPPHYEYKAEQLWTGWWGDWGSNDHINNRLNDQAKNGWRLVDSRSAVRLWWWFAPRPKVLLFFERARDS